MPPELINIIYAFIIILSCYLLSIFIENFWNLDRPVLCYLLLLSFITSLFLHFHNALIPKWSFERLIVIGQCYDPNYTALITLGIWMFLSTFYYYIVIRKPQIEEKAADGKYNGHYKKTGLKEDIITCRATGLPIINEIIEGTDCEGYTLIGQLEHLQELGIHTKNHRVDGIYPTLENIAVAQTMFGTTLHYQVQDRLVIREDGYARTHQETLPAILGRYGLQTRCQFERDDGLSYP